MAKPRQIELAFADSPVGGALAKGLIAEADLLRLKAIARLLARGLPDLCWSDLLHEAIARTLGGSRRRPANIPIVAFLAGVMRSIRSEHWRRIKREALVHEAHARVRLLETDTMADPERNIAAQQQLAAIDRLFADDAQALKVLSGLAHGLSAEEIQKVHAMSKSDYDSTRKRIRRALLREGLAWRRP